MSGISTTLRNFIHRGYFFLSCTAKTPPRTLTQNTSKDAVPRKDVLFRGHNQNLTFKTFFFFRDNRHFWARFRLDFEICTRKHFNIGYAHVNGP